MPLTCPGALTLPSTASSLAEGSPSPPSPPSHCGLPPKSLGASVRKNHWRGKMTATAKCKQKAGNSMKGFYSINISGTFIQQAGGFLTAPLYFSHVIIWLFLLLPQAPCPANVTSTTVPSLWLTHVFYLYNVHINTFRGMSTVVPHTIPSSKNSPDVHQR